MGVSGPSLLTEFTDSIFISGYFCLDHPNAATNEIHGVSEKSAELVHLPPLSLYFQLPVTYPSHDPPSYTLSCKWINFSSVSIRRVELCTVHVGQV